MKRLSHRQLGALCFLVAVTLWAACVLVLVPSSHQTPYIRDPGRLANDAPPNLVSRLILVGDAGANQKGDALLVTLGRRASVEPSRTLVVFLGDNIYPDGLVAEDHPGYAQARERLLNQIEAVLASGAEFYFVPGNHDWARGTETGLANVQRAARFIAEHAAGRGRQFPEPGSPGPHCLDRLGLRLVFMDTQWFLQPEMEADHASAERAFSELRRCAQEASAHVVVLGHHPMYTLGVHGDFYTARQHFFPLTDVVSWLYLPVPVVGSLYPLLRSQGVSRQDVSGELNRVLMARLREAFGAERPLIYAAGHEHNLQLHEAAAGPRYSLVSGSGSTATAVGHDDRTLYAQSSRGFMELDIYENGRVDLTVIARPNPDDLASALVPTFRTTLAESR